MAWDPVGQDFVDPFGGQEDLERRLIRCVGSATARFSEDGLRPLRAVRFAAVLDFSLDPDTQAAIRPTLPIFQKVALERVRDEFVKLLLSRKAVFGLELLADTGLLGVFLPEVAEAEPEAARRAREAAAAAPAEVELRLAALLADLVEPARAEEIGTRLKFPAKVIERIRLLVTHAAVESLVGAPDQALRRLLSKVGLAQLEALLSVAACPGRHEAAADGEGPGAQRRSNHVGARRGALADGGGGDALPRGTGAGRARAQHAGDPPGVADGLAEFAECLISSAVGGPGPRGAPGRTTHRGWDWPPCPRGERGRPRVRAPAPRARGRRRGPSPRRARGL
ncbi:[cytidine(C)-cytidine(C)-adenosine (A)]-adding enzyme [Cystobacter fuscus]|uniref:[cytidine(C)-cytidine(C)-adenosine (A)]-adding enzyme n=1 Tax=Cystobacter fuscus TaxID=43 RepID=A0A250JDS5_9BACT|nr:[cytidine(C)-cytidine(C)-adenosine (A)]-adding enzyme [Cystobacter fuscus]